VPAAHAGPACPRMSAMTRAEDLAAELEGAYLGFADQVAGLSPEEWRAPCANHPDIVRGRDEERAVGVVAHHVGDTLPMIVQRALRLAAGETPAPLSPADIEGINAKHALANQSPDQAATVSMIRDNARRAVAILRELTDQQLERGAAGDVTAETFLRRIAIGHVRWHQGSVSATVARESPGTPRGATRS
jgi:hypothetical protein